MLIQRASNILPSEITPEGVYRNRREFLKASLLAPLAGAGQATGGTDKVTPYEYATTYNNYYEFGTDRSDPSKNSGKFRVTPWTVTVEGLVKKPARYDLDDLLKGIPVEDRVYRMRCVERWSMVIPWRGIALASLVRKLEPSSSARYIEFKAIFAKDQMPGQRSRSFGGGLDWPYAEGLRLDEATNPLSLLATGIYGKPLPNQNGAPLRLVTPWKYGFKGIKAIVAIRFVDKQPVSSWMRAWPEAYGFYANVNPSVDHPRWSQTREERVGEAGNALSSLLGQGIHKTLMFNGYGEQVAQMYADMDLRKNY
jgi:sulfoxide reductase catalytic subunit YedY